MPRKSATVVSKRKAEEMQEEPPSRERSLTKKVKKNNFAEAILGTAEVDLNLSEKFAQNILSPTKSPSKSVPKTKPATRKSTKKLDIESPKHEEAKNSDDELVFKRVGRPKKSENKKKKITETPEFNDHIDAEPTPNKIQTRTKTKTLPRNSYFDELFYTGSDDEKDKKVPTPNKSKSASNTPVKGRGRPKVIKEDEKPSKIEETSKPESKQPGRKRRVLVELPVPSAEDFLPSPIIEPDEKKEEKSETDKPKRGRKSKTPNDKSPTKSKSKNKEKSETLPSETPTSSKKRGRPPKNKSVEDSASKSQKKKGKKKDKDGDNDSEEPATPPPKSIKKKPLVEEDDSDEENAIGSKSRLARPTSSVNRVKIVGSHHKDKRIDSILKKIDDAVLKLQEYTLPDKIPCREQEKEIIQKFIEEGLANDGLSHCLYISGVPGIGKTISVLEILKQIREENKKKDFNFIHINGLNMINPENIYQILLKEVTKITNVTNSTACLILDNVFQKGTLPKSFKQYQNQIDKRVRVVLLDEMDYMITKDQTLLYNLFDWTQQKNSKLVMIGIANTMNLKDQFLPKIQSRMGDRSLVYKPYTSQQIETILLNRIEGMDIILPETIKFLSKKIATFSSDIRRTLHVCREALRICAEELVQLYARDPNSIKETGVVTIEHIRASHSLIYSNPYHQCMEMLNENAKLVLIAIALDIKFKGQLYANLSEMSERIKFMTAKMNKKPLKIHDITGVVKQLIALGLVNEKQKSYLRRDKETTGQQYTNLNDNQISLRITVDDITNSLRNDALFGQLLD